MEKITKKLEEVFESEINKIQESPIKTGLKWLIILYLTKKAYKWFIKD